MKEKQMLDNETEHQLHPHNVSVRGGKITNWGDGQGDIPGLKKAKLNMGHSQLATTKFRL